MSNKMETVERLAFARWLQERGLDCAQLGQYPHACCCLRTATLAFEDLAEQALEQDCRLQLTRTTEEWFSHQQENQVPPQDTRPKMTFAEALSATPSAWTIHDQGSGPTGSSKDKSQTASLPALAFGDTDLHWSSQGLIPHPDARVTRQELLLLGLHLAATENTLEAIGLLAIWLDVMGPVNRYFAASADECLAWQTLARLRKEIGFTAFESLLKRIGVGGHDPYWPWEDDDSKLPAEPDEQATLAQIVPLTVQYGQHFRGMDGAWEYTLVYLAQIASAKGNKPLAECLFAVQAYLSGSSRSESLVKIPAKFLSAWGEFLQWCG